MKRYKIFLIISSLLLSVGCGNASNNYNGGGTTDSAISNKRLSRENDDIILTEISNRDLDISIEKFEMDYDNILPDKGYNYGNCIGDDEFIYCKADKSENMEQYASNIKILRINRLSKEVNVLYETANKSGQWINELVLTGHGLAWVYTDGKDTKIMNYSIASNEVNILKELNHGNVQLLLSGGDDILVWSDAENKSQINIINLLSLKEETISSFADEYPYSRPRIIDNKFWYREKGGNSNAIYYDGLVSDNLDEIMTVDIGEMNAIFGDKDYILWENELRDSETLNIFVYYIEEEMGYNLGKESLKDLFSAHYLGDGWIILNCNKSIKALNLKEKKICSILSAEDNDEFYGYGYLGLNKDIYFLLNNRQQFKVIRVSL